MPLIQQEQVQLNPEDFQTSGLYEQEQNIPIKETLSAAFQRFNTIGSTLSQEDGNIVGQVDPNYDVMEKLKSTPYLYRSNEFFDINNDADFERRMAQIQKEDENVATLSQAGTVGVVSSLAAGILDPINLIPGIGMADKAYTAVKAGRVFNAIREGATAAGVTGAVQATVGEAIFQGTQRTRTIDESALNIVGAATLGGILGAGMGYVASRNILKQADDVLKSTLKSPDGEVDVRVAEPDSASAARVDATVIKPTGVPEWVLRAPTAGIEAITAPSVRGITSSSQFVRRMTNELFETNIRVDGIKAPAIESLLKADRVANFKFSETAQDQYLSYLGVKNGPMETTRGFFEAKRSGKMTRAEFDDAVGRAMRRGDESEIPQVQAVAKHLRGQMEKLNKRMQELKILPEDLKLSAGTTSYLTRVYNIDAVKTNRVAFEQQLTNHLVLRHKLAKTEAQEVARSATDNIIGVGNKDTNILGDYLVSQLDTGVAFTKDRTLDIPDSEIEDFLVSDSFKIGQRYIEDANRLIRSKEFLDRNGWSSFNDMRAELKSEYDYAITKNPENSGTLTKEYEKNRDLLDAFIAINNNKYLRRTKADSVLRALRTYQYMTMMGYLVVSSTTDLAMPILKHGLGKDLIEGWTTGIRDMFGGNLIKKDLQDLGVGIELELNDTVRNIMDTPERTYGMQNTFSQKLNDLNTASSNVFSRVNLSAYWNNAHKRIAARTTESRMFRDMKDFDNLPKKETAYLSELGIDKNMSDRIQAQYKKYGADYKGGHLVNIAAWDDAGAADVFKAAVQKEVDSTIITPGKGDQPLITQRYELAKNILQFKGFFSAMMSKAVLPSLQRKDSEALQGVLALLALGGVQYYLRTSLSGRTPNMETKNLMKESLNRSGLLGLLGDPIFGLFLNTGRYMNGSVQSTVLGASLSSAESGYKAGRAALDKKWDQAWKYGQKLVPYQNLFYLRLLFDKADNTKKGV